MIVFSKTKCDKLRYKTFFKTIYEVIVFADMPYILRGLNGNMGACFSYLKILPWI